MRDGVNRTSSDSEFQSDVAIIEKTRFQVGDPQASLGVATHSIPVYCMRWRWDSSGMCLLLFISPVYINEIEAGLIAHFLLILALK